MCVSASHLGRDVPKADVIGVGAESRFAENLERLAGLHRLNMKEVAALTGVSESVISKWVSGDRWPSFGSALRIADFFEVDATKLARADFSDLLASDLANPERYATVEQRIKQFRSSSGEKV